MIDEAKPCPFCGASPELRPKNPKQEGDAWAAIVCVNTECPTFSWVFNEGVRVDDGEDVADSRGSAAYVAAAIRRWNVRK